MKTLAVAALDGNLAYICQLFFVMSLKTYVLIDEFYTKASPSRSCSESWVLRHNENEL